MRLSQTSNCKTGEKNLPSLNHSELNRWTERLIEDAFSGIAMRVRYSICFSAPY